jgi:hypothetical protein
MTGGATLSESGTDLTRTQRWANALTVLVAMGSLALGFLLKGQTLGSTLPFRDLAAGISARYPDGWLVDSTEDYVFRAREPELSGFSTTLQVAVRAIGSDASARNILDSQTMERAQVLAAYRPFNTVPFTLPDGEAAIRHDYVYVATQTNPYLEHIPVVVHGVDIVTIKRGQAIIVSFRVEADRFEEEVWRLDQFLASLEF